MCEPLTNETIRAWIQLHRSQRILLEKVEQALKGAGLPPLAWYDVLLELGREKSQGLRQFEIGERVLLSKYNLSRLLDRLEKKNLTERHACKEDGRGNWIRITDEGEKVLKQIWPVYSMSIQENFGSKLDSKELAELDRILKKTLRP